MRRAREHAQPAAMVIDQALEGGRLPVATASLRARRGHRVAGKVPGNRPVLELADVPGEEAAAQPGVEVLPG